MFSHVLGGQPIVYPRMTTRNPPSGKMTSPEPRSEASMRSGPQRLEPAAEEQMPNDAVPKKRRKLLLRQLEATEGVDMFKEKFTDADEVKLKGGKTLRGQPQQIQPQKAEEQHKSSRKRGPRPSMMKKRGRRSKIESNRAYTLAHMHAHTCLSQMLASQMI